MGRKTIKREVVVEKLNKAMRASHLSLEEKQVIATFATSILITGNTYEGYTIPEPGAKVDEHIYF
jgi:hypothetical protein